MKAIILAGGKGQRLKKIISEVPKPMAPIGDKPFLEYLVLQLVRSGIDDIIISIGYKAHIIKDYFRDGAAWGARIQYSEEKEPLGTGGALKLALLLLDNTECIVLNGDSFLAVDFFGLLDFHRLSKALVTLQLVAVDDVSRYGLVTIKDNGIINAFQEKGGTGAGMINGGVYIVNKDVIVAVPNGKASFETDVLPYLIDKGLYGMSADIFFVDIGIPESYFDLCRNPQPLFQIYPVKG